jgi:uncharacterized metal-binding protein YceD (DUF177 family)
VTHEIVHGEPKSRDALFAGETVAVDMRVCRAGAGFYVTAGVAATLALQCDCCPRVFRHPVRGEFQVTTL